MTIEPGQEFKAVATPDAEALRKLRYLAGQDNDSVLTGTLKSTKSAFGEPDSAGAKKRAGSMMQMAMLTDPDYQAMSARINENLDRMDEASVRALQDIEQELTGLRRARERIQGQAYHDEQGRAIFMTKNGAAAYYEDGTKVDDDEFARHRGELQGKPSWEELQAITQRRDDLLAERNLIHQHETSREELREAVAMGEISKEEAERRERELEDALPERVREHFRSLRGETADHDAGTDAASDADSDLALSTEEEAMHNTGLSSPGFTPG